ncbi:MAG: alanine racemase [Candidatus Eisenbacteria sp.]|nr:alanine racemase [Candidatus Eisenbacteria bacterium]
MLHPSRIEISRGALRRNFRFLKTQVGAQTRISSVIKGNAYGHGIGIFVPLAEECGIRHFSVFSADEALRTHQSRRAESDIAIMGYIADEAIEWAISEGIEFYVFDLGRLEAAGRVAARVGQPARIHLALETGMNRTGFDEPELERAVEYIQAHPDAFTIEGLCTHFAGAESVANHVRVRAQFDRYNAMHAWLDAQGIRARYRHVACSAAALTYPDTLLDMVRLGIAQYGLWPSAETRMRHFQRNSGNSEHRFVDPLSRVMRWSSRIMSIKRVKPGDFVGYGTSYLVTRNQCLAAVPVGYYHGFPRSLSNLGHVLVNGRRAPVVGVVNMSAIMVDITDCADVQRGDEVVIIGRQKRGVITVSSFGDLTRNVNYEVLTRVPAEIPRCVVD